MGPFEICPDRGQMWSLPLLFEQEHYGGLYGFSRP